MNKILLNKTSEFVNLALDQISQLENEKQAALQKQAAFDAKLNVALEKAASALYNSDFITDDLEKSEFVKRAKEDPSYLAKVIEKVCNAADVSLIGDTARVALSNKTSEEYDPIMAKTFGWNDSSTILDL